jgi:NTP pyrophosphatase (non-canonical NTP hydrolase)
MINELSKKIHQNARDKGFYAAPRNIGEMLCLIHSEVSEALECDRKEFFAHLTTEQESILSGSPTDSDFQTYFQEFVKDTFEDELADIMIRVMDLAEHKGVDLEKHILLKMRYNSLRPHKHGKLY